MSQLRAYFGDSNLREQFLEKMHWHYAQKRSEDLTPFEEYGLSSLRMLGLLSDEKLEYGDRTPWVKVLGFPEWFVLVCDWFPVSFAQRTDAPDYAVETTEDGDSALRILDAVRCGQVLDAIKIPFTLHILGLASARANAHVLPIIDSVTALHQRAQSGEDVPMAEWDAARMAAWDMYSADGMYAVESALGAVTVAAYAAERPADFHMRSLIGPLCQAYGRSAVADEEVITPAALNALATERTTAVLMRDALIQLLNAQAAS